MLDKSPVRSHDIWSVTTGGSEQGVRPQPEYFMSFPIRTALLAVAVTGTAGCFLRMPCGLKHGTGVTTDGTVAAGEHSTHTLSLTPGAQNDVYVTPRDTTQIGVTYTIYVTSVGCSTFSPNTPKWFPSYPVIPQDPCAVISVDTLKQQRVVTAVRAKYGLGAHTRVFAHEVGGANQFKLWIIGDSRQRVAFDVSVTWTSGHDC